MTYDADVRVGRRERGVARQGLEFVAVPCLPDDRREDVAVTLHNGEGLGKFRLDRQESFIGGARVYDLPVLLFRAPLHDGIADLGYKTLA